MNKIIGLFVGLQEINIRLKKLDVLKRKSTIKDTVKSGRTTAIKSVTTIIVLN